jgi:hypothetical protein
MQDCERERVGAEVMRTRIKVAVMTATVTTSLAVLAAPSAQGATNLQALLDNAGPSVTVPAGAYDLNDGLTIPPGVTRVNLTGVTLRQHGNPQYGTLSKRGSLGDAHQIAPAEDGATSVRLTGADSAGVEVGDVVVAVSDDSFSGTKPMAPGHLRVVKSVEGSVIGIDTPLNRPLRSNPQLIEVNLASQVTVVGGVVEHAEKLTSFYPAVTMHFVTAPVIDGTEVREHGADGILFNGVFGGEVRDVTVHDLVDDGAGKRFGKGRHQGYGITMTGTSRDVLVTGECWAARHCFTTNAAYWVIDDRVKGKGDPEDITVTMTARDTTSTGLDTHEPGYRITFLNCTVTNPGRYRAAGSTNGKEGGSAFFIRSRATSVIGGSASGAQDDVVEVARPAPSGTPWAADEYAVIDGLSTEGNPDVSKVIDTHQGTVVTPEGTERR